MVFPSLRIRCYQIPLAYNCISSFISVTINRSLPRDGIPLLATALSPVQPILEVEPLFAFRYFLVSLTCHFELSIQYF